MYTQISHGTAVPYGKPSNLKLLDDPIFYSVLLGLVSFTFSYIITLSEDYPYNFIVPYYLYFVVIIISIISSLISPFIIHLIKQKYSIIASLLLLLIGYFICNRGQSIGIVIMGKILNTFSFQLSTISISTLLIFIFWESKYLNLLFGLFFIIQQSFNISSSYISYYGMNRIIGGQFIGLIIIALLFTIVLYQPDFSYSTHSSDPVQHKYIVSKESKIFYLIPILLFFGFQAYIFSSVLAAIALIPITFIINRYGKLNLFKILMVFGGVSIISGFILVYINTNYSSGFISFLKFISCLGYSVFIIGITMIISTMISTGDVFPKESVLSIVSVFQGIQSLGTILSTLISLFISPWLNWYILNALFIIGSILFLLFLKTRCQKNICC